LSLLLYVIFTSVKTKYIIKNHIDLQQFEKIIDLLMKFYLFVLNFIKKTKIKCLI